MSSLEKAVKGDVDLSIAFLSAERKQEDFEYEGVDYHSVNPYKSRFYILFRLKRLLMGPRARDRRILRRVREVVSQVSPDLIHIHGTENCFGLIACDPGALPRDPSGKEIPIAVSMQGIMGPYLEKYFSGIPAEAVRRFESVGRKLRKQGAFRAYRKMRHQAGNERIILRSIRHVFGRTEWDRAETLRANPAARYFVVGEIMRAPFFSDAGRLDTSDGKAVRKDDGRSEGRFRIVSTVSEGIYKGYEQLLRIAACLKRAKVEFEWTVIGQTAESEMVRIAESYTGLDSAALGIRLAGRLTADSMVEILDSADVYCHVSHIENSPNSVCEAMLRGLPVVAANVGGVSSIVEDGVSGLLFRDSDPEDGAAALISLHGHPGAASEIGQIGRQIALKRHSPATVRSQLLQAYRAVLADKDNDMNIN